MRYAGIGARATPDYILETMRRKGAEYACKGLILRSGGAIGADQAYEFGCDFIRPPGRKEIFDKFSASGNSHWFEHAKKYHPEWDKLSNMGKMLMARNSAILLGADLSTPVEFIDCWTINGEIRGGTGQALRIAKDYRIPVNNMGSKL